jgi:hypothetical protein
MWAVKNTTAGNNSTAAWKVYVDGTQRITWTGAGVTDGGDGFLMGSETLSSTGTWLFDWVSCRNDGEFSPAQWDPLY